VATVIDARPAALVNGRGVTWGELRPTLGDAAGAEALREVILDVRLEEAMTLAGITLTDDDIAKERRRLLEELSEDPATSLRLLDELRDRQRLGQQRFEELVRRSAELRALVRDEVVIEPDTVSRAHAMRHGPRRQVRLLTVPDLATASASTDRVSSGDFFGDVAVEISTDTSAPRGGLLQPMSAVDPSYPAALRQAVFALAAEGEVSDPILLPSGYAVVELVRIVPGDGVTLAEARIDLERRVRLAEERRLMDQLARRLLTSTTVTIFDEQLNESWERFKRSVRREASGGVVAVP
jgi:hypothetical protein